MKRISFSGITVLILSITIIWVSFNICNWKNPDSVIAWDVKSYYAYLPATFIYKDLTFSFRQDKPEYSDWFWPFTAPNGGLVIITSMGMSMLYSPFFFLAHGYTIMTSPEEATGFSKPYAFMLVMSTIFYASVGLIFLRKLLLRFFNDTVSTFVIIAVFLGTNLFCYSTTHSVMSHAYSFCLITIFILFTDRWYDHPNVKNSIVLGLTGGLISLIRPTNIIVVVLFIFWNWHGYSEIRTRLQLFYKKGLMILIIILTAFLIWLPQLIYWKSITGHWLYYSYGPDNQFFFNNPQWFKVLFSFRNGWFIYSPIMFVAVAGIAFMIKNYKIIFFPVLIYFILNVYIVSSWWCWWYGGSFGLRAFIDSYAVYALPLGVVFQRTFPVKKIYRYCLFSLYLILIIICQFFSYKYRYGSIHFDSMTHEALFDSFWRLKPSKTFYKKLKTPDYDLARKGIYEKDYKNKTK
ncbi:MAG: hypothetical protein JXK95_09325 [Bacteroidales bacterium]|nr:hypothetical protein [Bacteroidales bacterium]